MLWCVCNFGTIPQTFNCLGVRVSSLSKKDIGKQTLDYYTKQSHESEQLSPSLLTPVNDHNVSTISSTVSSESSSSSVTCPVCNKLVQCDNDLLNKHIDVCLNRQVISSDDASKSSPKANKHKRSDSSKANENCTILRIFIYIIINLLC